MIDEHDGWRYTHAQRQQHRRPHTERAATAFVPAAAIIIVVVVVIPAGRYWPTATRVANAAAASKGMCPHDAGGQKRE